jgi:hypothetical protein
MVKKIPNPKGKVIGHHILTISKDKNKSSGKCWMIVREAIQLGLKLPVQGTGIESAVDAGSWLKDKGY